MEKQIEEIKDCIDNVYGCDCAYYGVDGLAIAETLYNAGYRKQIEGEWRLEKCQSGLFSIDQFFICSACKQEFIVEGWDYEDLVANAKFCPNCGARMQGEKNEKRID